MDDWNTKRNLKKCIYIYIYIKFFFIFLIPTYKTHWIKHTLFFVMNFKEKESRNYFPCFWPLNKNNDSMEKRWWNSLCMASSMKRIFYLDDDGIPFSAEPSSLLWISGVIIIIACWKPRSQCFARWVRLGPICVSDSTWICLNPTIPHLSYKENFKHSFKNFNYDKNRYNNNFIIYLLWKLFFSFHVSKKRKLKNI